MPTPRDNDADHLQALLARYRGQHSEGVATYFSEEDYDTLLLHFYEQHDFDATLDLADQAISQYAYNPEFYKWKALIHKINLEEDAAMAALERLNSYAPNDEEVLLLRLEVLVHFEKTGAARALHTRLYGMLRGQAKRSLLYFFDGLILIQESDTRSAWSALLRAMHLDPYQEPAVDELLNAAEFIYLRPELGKELHLALNRDPFNHLLWYYLGLWHDDFGREAKALDAFSYARSLSEADPRYELDYADKLFDLEKFEECLSAYAIYLQRPDAHHNYETYMRIGRSHQVLNNLSEAKKAYLTALDLDPSMYDIYQHLGECHVTETNWKKAVYYYELAVEQPGHTADCWLGLALCRAAYGKVAAAEEAFRRAISFDDKYSDAYVSYAIVLVEDGREEEARELLTGVLSRYEDAGLLYGMVAVCFMTQRRRLGLDYLNEALSRFYAEHTMLTDWYPDLLEDTEVQALFSLYRD